MKNGIKTLAIWLIIGVIVFVGVSAIYDNADRKLSYSELVSKVDKGEVSVIDIGASGRVAEPRPDPGGGLQQV